MRAIQLTSGQGTVGASPTQKNEIRDGEGASPPPGFPRAPGHGETAPTAHLWGADRNEDLLPTLPEGPWHVFSGSHTPLCQIGCPHHRGRGQGDLPEQGHCPGAGVRQVPRPPRGRTQPADPRSACPRRAHLLLCWPVRCRNAFRVALRSSLIFSCRGNAGRQAAGAAQVEGGPPGPGAWSL